MWAAEAATVSNVRYRAEDHGAGCAGADGLRMMNDAGTGTSLRRPDGQPGRRGRPRPRAAFAPCRPAPEQRQRRARAGSRPADLRMDRPAVDLAARSEGRAVAR